MNWKALLLIGCCGIVYWYVAHALIVDFCAHNPGAPAGLVRTLDLLR